jgi:YfiH family protein
MVTHRLIETEGRHVSGGNVLREGTSWTGPPSWREFDWLWHGFSTRRGGVSQAYRGVPAPDLPARDVSEAPALAGLDSGGEYSGGELNLGFTTADREELVRENRLRLVEGITGSRDIPLFALRQVHSNRTVVVEHPNLVWPVDAIPEADGMMTQASGLLLGIQTADCIPVLLVDVANRVVAGFHAGWRGTVRRIVELGVRRMRLEFGSKPDNMLAAIGPGIGACCYAVGGEVQAKFGESFEYGADLFHLVEGNDPQGPRFHLDLREANRRQLLDAGLPEQAISLVGGCTSCEPELYFSHRASGGHAGRMMAVIGIRPGNGQG